MSDLSDEELVDVEKRYRDHKPTRPCQTCGGTEWALTSSGRGRETWACKAAADSRPMDWEHYGASSHAVMSGDSDVLNLVSELRRHRVAQRTNTERVWQAVRNAVIDVSSIGPPLRNIETLHIHIAAIANRVVAELATPIPSRCDECDPSFQCFDGRNACYKRPLHVPASAPTVSREAIQALRDEWAKHANREWLGQSFIDDLDWLLGGAR